MSWPWSSALPADMIRELLQAGQPGEASDLRWQEDHWCIGAISDWEEWLQVPGGGERSLADGSDQRWRRTILCGGERSQARMEGSYYQSRGVITGWATTWVEGSQVEGSDRRWRGAITGEKERSPVKGSDCYWSEAITIWRDKSQVERCDRQWSRAITGGRERSQNDTDGGIGGGERS